MISETSKQAFESVKHNLAPACCFIYSRFQIYGNMTNEELAELTGWKINRVTPRTNDLLNNVDTFGRTAPLIEVKGYKPGPSGRMARVLGVVTQNNQMEMGI